MKPYYEDARATVHAGDCLDVLRSLPDASVDAVVTDPPYLLGFMGRAWDTRAAHEHLDWHRAWCDEAFRVLKPGGHILAFGGTRTWHRLACAVEDAGFEIRDSIAWLYGSGFPKSLDVSKAIDKLDASDERLQRAVRFTSWMRTTGLTAGQINEITGTYMGSHYLTDKSQAAIATAEMFDLLRPHLPVVPASIELLVAERTIESENYKARAVVGERITGIGTGKGATSVITDNPANRHVTVAHTPDAERWQGWGTALKPAFEPIVVARKPLAGTVAANVLAHGTGALNIDGCRVGTDGGTTRGANGSNAGRERNVLHGGNFGVEQIDGGRWPANVVLDESQAAALDEQSGELTSGANPTRRGVDGERNAYGDFAGQESCEAPRGADSGGASRFFFVTRKDNDPCSDDSSDSHPSTDTTGTIGPDGSAAPAGESLSAAPVERPTFTDYSYPQTWVAGLLVDDLPARFRYVAKADASERVRVNGTAHPTVKPLALMRWLVRLVTPPGGTVLEPFAGSGATVEACLLEGFKCIAIEREADYLPLIRQRINRRRDPVEAVKGAGEEGGLFDLLGEEPA